MGLQEESLLGFYDQEGNHHPFREVYGGWHIKDLPPDERGRPRCVHVYPMAFNWRISRWVGECDSLLGGFQQHYCYQGISQRVFTLALLSAIGWDGTSENPPLRWNKNVQTGEWIDPPGYMPEDSITEVKKVDVHPMPRDFRG